MTKELIINKIFSIQDQVINDLKERISVLKAAADLDEDETIDLDEFSQQNESNEMNELLLNQLEKAEKDKLRLNSINFSVKSEIELGAVVKTDQFSFVVGIATFPFNIDGNQFVGISTEAPIYSMMKGKVAGETFYFANNKYEIVSIS
jgi:hypothetical protein